MSRVILHSDMNNFYASVECLYNPDLRGKPVAVAGDIEARHGIVLAKNYLAKAWGVKTGNPLWLAKDKCPDIIFVPPHYDLYLRYSKIAREIYGEYTDEVESFGLDECWLDVSGSTGLFGSGETIADELRERVKYELGVTVSVGVSYNKIFAKLGSDMRKPDATTVIKPQNFREQVWPLPVADLLYVGRATNRRFKNCGINTIGDLANTEKSLLKTILGQHGLMLWHFANGLDSSPVRKSGETPPIKSIGNSITTPRDLLNDNDVRITLYILCESVSARLREAGYICDTVQLSIRDTELYSYVRQGKLDAPTRSVEALFAKAFALYKLNHISGRPIRSLGVRACNLADSGYEQLSIFAAAPFSSRCEQLNAVVDDIRRRFGHNSIQRAITLTDPKLRALNPKDDHVIYPESFLHN